MSIFCFVAWTSAFGQRSHASALATRLDDLVKGYAANGAFMGSALVVRGDSVLLDRGYGSADLEWNIPNDSRVKFRIGSLTKQFTAALVLQLQESGQLRIDDPVNKYLPNPPETWKKITIAELLGHTSGIPNFITDSRYGTWKMSSHTVAEILAFFRDKPLHFEPGTDFEYSNSNYIVLGAIVERVGGKNYGTFLRDKLLEPLGMHESGLDSDELVLRRRAQGYMPTKEGFARARSESMTVPWAAGAMYSTTGDLIRWERGLFGGRVLSEKSLQAMTTPGKDGYGFGLMIHEQDGVTVVEHGGSIEGFNAHLSYVPKLKIGIVVLGNEDVFVPDTIASQLLDVILGKPVAPIGTEKGFPIAEEELARFVGVYFMAQISPGFTLKINRAGGSLTAQLTGREPTALVYRGLKDLHPRFYSPKELAEIEFVPNANGAIGSLVLHISGPGHTR